MATAADEVSGLGDRSLKKRVRQARRDFDKLGDAQPSAENLERLQATADVVVAGEQELRSRDHRRAVRGIPAARAMRDQVDADAARRAETEAARTAFNMIGRVSGETLVPSRLTAEQGKELLDLVRKSRKDEISAAESERWEQLVAIAADDPDLFERGRRKQELAKKQAQVAEQERLASLPQRGAPPPGSIILPGYLTQLLLEARDDGLTYSRLGVLAGVLLGLENRTGTLVGSRYSDGALVGASPRFRFDGQDGSPEVGDALTYLAMSGLLAIERGGPQGTSIRLGPRLEKFYEEAEKGGDDDGREA